jgi:histidyl-tRNA synthetase
MERLPGFRDFYPEPLPQPSEWSADARQYIFDKWRSMARRYAFREYDGPPLETLELFTTKSGDEIVGQLYKFTDKGERAVALRPEMTPTLARMIATYERSYKKPFKWFALPQLFRYERHQKGRLREHFQFNADIVGESDPAADAELIALLIDTLRSFGLDDQDFVIRLSSRNAWQDFYRQRQGDPAKEYAFFQIIDKLEREKQEVSDEKLKQAGLSFQAVSTFIEQGKATPELDAILSNLAARGLRDYVKIDYHVIRGLAYYTGVVFEAFDRKGEFRAIAGGGRYDNLIKLISGGKVDLPALGFGMGDVVLLEVLKARGLLPKSDAALDAFCLLEDENLRPASLRLIHDLRAAGLVVDYPLALTKPDKQFKRAQELKATNTVKLERNAAGEMLAKVRNLKSRQESLVPLQEVATHVRERKG